MVGGHYSIFTTAGNYLLHGKNPYGVEWGFGGLWFYSPVCGWFFGLLSLLPRGLGLFLFNMGSQLLLLEGFRRFFRLFPDGWRSNAYLSILIILSTGELIGAYQSIKLEMAMIGVLLIVAEQVSVRPILAGSMAALIINFKWFPAAPIGLLILSRLRQKEFKFAVSVPLFLLFWFLLPFLVYGRAFASELYLTQNASLDRFVSEVYLDFPSVFGMLKHTFGILLSKSAVSLGMMGAAGLLGVAIIFARYDAKRLTIVSIALGTLYVVNFNLLSQLNAYAIATPALAYMLFLCFSSSGWKRQVSILSVAAYWIVVSLFFSDLVPHSFRDQCREMLIKPLGSTIMLLTLLCILVADTLSARNAVSPATS